MKNLILLALICFSVNAACAEGARVFSVVANETTTADGSKIWFISTTSPER